MVQSISAKPQGFIPSKSQNHLEKVTQFEKRATMSQTEKRAINEIYKRYGFEAAQTYSNEKILVFTIKTGYFDNADIVLLDESADPKEAFDEYSKAGYACSVRGRITPEQAENQLFEGFFSVDSILERLENNYKKFTKAIVSPFSESIEYKYINAPYRVNGQQGELTPAEEVASRLESTRPTLFLIEAAAGFGKTCTAYELVHLLTTKRKHLPLFSELSRNRQATIFRYILLDEIDRTFPVLSSRLVQTEMKNGKVITILDGFDELLRKADDGSDFENREPMLETIGEFLTGNAKIVLTTRRTILFEGDAFHRWVDNHADDFDLVRIRISEPRTDHWLPPDRLETLRESGINIDKIANPVLLSYLKCITDEEFTKVAASPHLLVEKYFDFMLDREKTRQDLRISSERQQNILKSIADDMIKFEYTSDHRDNIVDLILRSNSNLLEQALLEYPGTEKPTKEELANKLASHALLDRSQQEPNKIGFINEFSLGHFVGKIILENNDWLNDDLRFIEPTVVSFQPRSAETKIELWNKLKDSLEFVSTSDRVDIALRLTNKIPFKISNDEINGLEITNTEIGTHKIEDTQFNECVFKNCQFNLKEISNTTFLNCRYFNNSITNKTPGGPIHVLGGSGDHAFIEKLSEADNAPPPLPEPDAQLIHQRFILEKFWPKGKETVTHKHRPIKGVCVNNGEYKTHDLYAAITSLKKIDILREPIQGDFIEINLEKIQEIREILNRPIQNGK